MSRSDQKEGLVPESLEEQFYSKKLYHSYSSLNKLLFSPRLYYNHYILGQREDKKESYLIEGSIIHCLLLDDGSFDKNFIVSPANLPSDNNRRIVDSVFYGLKDPGELIEYNESILVKLLEINLHQSLKTDQQRIDKIITEETKNYWSYLKSKGNKDIVDQETLSKCQESVTILKQDIKIRDLLKLDSPKSFDRRNEVILGTEKTSVTDAFGLRGILDNLVIDDKAKIIYINDLKTTGKTIAEFKDDTIDHYNYWLQAAVYVELVKEYFKKLITPEWKIIFHFIVIDKYNQIYPFEVSYVTMCKWTERMKDVLKIAEYHYKNRTYSLPHEFLTKQVIL